MKLNLTTKLLVCFLLVGLIPLGIICAIAYRADQQLENNVTHSYRTIATGVNDKIDRNLFERYGDVQAFGLNSAVLDHGSWYQVGSGTNKIAEAANQYAALYGFYLISLAVDLDGRVIAVNDRGPDGKPIQTSGFYNRNFKDAVWFKEVMAGHFLKSDSLTGTYVEDVHVDKDVKDVYGDDGIVLGFSAPIKDEQGKVIGVWHNVASFSLVEQIIVDAYADLKRQNLGSAEMTLLDGTGRVIVDYDPTLHNGDTKIHHDPAVLLKLNLAESGVEAARQVVAGESGGIRSLHARKQIWQSCGYSASQGALGYPGLHWGMLVRVDEKESLAVNRAISHRIMLVVIMSVIGLIVVALWLGRSISRPIAEGMYVIEEAGNQVSSAAGQVSSASQSLAEGASEQAASLEETSSSLEEMASMTKRNAENAQKANDLAKQTRAVADKGATDMQTMNSAMEAIKISSDDIAKIIKTIDEIAFQTNILALNAAVEAARAGEAGMGFAVVADEVRNLAQRSATAAKETAVKIEGAISKTGQGVEISRKVSETLNEIVTKARQMDELAAEVAGASREQTQGITQINMAVGQMDKVTQSNAASAEESAAAAEELNAQAETMKHSVDELLSLIHGQNRTASPVVMAAHKPSPTVKPNPAKARPSVSVASNGHAHEVPVPVMANGGNGRRHSEIPMEGDFKDF